MLYHAFTLIRYLESAIGNGAKVNLSVENKRFEIRVSWMDVGLNVQQTFITENMTEPKLEEIVVERFVSFCRMKYIEKIGEIDATT